MLLWISNYKFTINSLQKCFFQYFHVFLTEKVNYCVPVENIYACFINIQVTHEVKINVH